MGIPGATLVLLIWWHHPQARPPLRVTPNGLPLVASSPGPGAFGEQQGGRDLVLSSDLPHQFHDLGDLANGQCLTQHNVKMWVKSHCPQPAAMNILTSRKCCLFQPTSGFPKMCPLTSSAAVFWPGYWFTPGDAQEPASDHRVSWATLRVGRPSHIRGQPSRQNLRHEFEQALGVGDGQGSLACCSLWGCKNPEQLNWQVHPPLYKWPNFIPPLLFLTSHICGPN